MPLCLVSGNDGDFTTRLWPEPNTNMHAVRSLKPLCTGVDTHSLEPGIKHLSILCDQCLDNLDTCSGCTRDYQNKAGCKCLNMLEETRVRREGYSQCRLQHTINSHVHNKRYCMAVAIDSLRHRQQGSLPYECNNLFPVCQKLRLHSSNYMILLSITRNLVA